MEELVVLVRLVRADQRIDEVRGRAGVGGDVLERAHVLGQARPAEGTAGAGVIGAEVELGVALEDRVDFLRGDAEVLAHAADLVGEGDLDRVPRVVDELGDLGLAQADFEDGRVDALVELRHVGRRLAAQRADDDLGRVEEVLDRGGFAQEFGVVDQLDHVRGRIAQVALEDRPDDVLAGPGPHGRAVGEGQRGLAIGLQRGGDRAGDLRDIAHVVRAIDAARRADADDGDVGIVELVGELRGCGDPAIGMGGREQIVEPRFVDRRAARVKGGDLGLADVDSDDRVALTGNAARSGRADVTQSENGNFHDQSFKVRPSGRRPRSKQVGMLQCITDRHPTDGATIRSSIRSSGRSSSDLQPFSRGFRLWHLSCRLAPQN